MKLNFFSKKKAGKTDEQLNLRECESINCSQNGSYQAPKKDGTSNRQHPETWHWFCLKHVRLYNQEWNYFSQMSEDEVLETWRKDVTWERPSWPLGSWQGKKWRKEEQRLASKNYSDPFGLFEDEFTAAANSKPPKMPLHPEDQEFLRLLGLSFPFTEKQLQLAYREMVKKHHPDVNHGCPKAEELLKLINHAYTTLKNKPLK